ncbi:MAG TPA: helix-turn-helix domain-containing protein [Candidatus Nanoarchaeia archaeon]|nr:helix-turn-helix domain-containing protein [Candidatus Nanoarchaeia archaeon]
MYEESLKQFGLTSGEARVYVALMRLGPSTVGPIVKMSKVAYSKIYDILGRLTEKGLVSHTTKEKTRFFQPVEPLRLLDYLQRQEMQIEQNKQKLQEILPALNSIAAQHERQEAEIFTGHRGLLSAYELLLKRTPKNGVIRFFYVYDPIYGQQIYDFYFKSGVFFRKVEEYYKKAGISWKGIANRKENKATPAFSSRLPHGMQQLFVSFPIPGNIDISEDTVLIAAWGAIPIGILLHSKEIAQNFKIYFDALWQMCEAQLSQQQKRKGLKKVLSRR